MSRHDHTCRPFVDHHPSLAEQRHEHRRQILRMVGQIAFGIGLACIAIYFGATT